MPRLIIAGTQSGAGKTSLTLALVASLKRRGLQVQTFKVGPDFLDPSYLALASERPCYNLDGWMTSKDYVLELFFRTTRDVDIAVIEGVMGLFDGSDPSTSEGSTAEIAKWLQVPVLLVVNVHGMARSLAAVVKGFVEFDKDLRIAGVIANYGGSDRHREWLTQSLDSASLPPLLGVIPRGALPFLPNRHLGLVTASPQTLTPDVLDHLADSFEKNVPLKKVMEIASSSPPLFPPKPASDEKPLPRRISIGMAYDRAFHFYYPDNLNQLELRGCEVIRFSPIEDRLLPEGLNGLYFGGGYPEEYAEALSDNQEMLEAIRQYAQKGLPIYAECGGLMYLTSGIETLQGKRYPMVGLLPVWTKMLRHLKSLGYVEVTLREKSLWGEIGTVLRGHEFHYSEMTQNLPEHPWKPVYEIRRRRSDKLEFEGYQKGKILTSYVHLHWASRPRAMETFINQCEAKG